MDNIPDEILCMILDYARNSLSKIENKNRLTIKLVCKRWKLCSDTEFDRDIAILRNLLRNKNARQTGILCRIANKINNEKINKIKQVILGVSKVSEDPKDFEHLEIKLLSDEIKITFTYHYLGYCREEYWIGFVINISKNSYVSISDEYLICTVYLSDINSLKYFCKEINDSIETYNKERAGDNSLGGPLNDDSSDEDMYELLYLSDEFLEELLEKIEEIKLLEGF